MKAVIFDLDGTLLDTIDDIADSMNIVLAKHDLPQHSVEEYKMFVGDGAATLVKRAAQGAGSPGISPAQLESEYKAEYLKRQAVKTAPYTGMPELLSALARLGIKMAVLSNKSHPATIEVMAHYFPDVSFSALIGHRQGHPVKPNPAGVFEILGILGVKSEETLYVGDTATDVLTAKAAGLRSVGVLWGFRDKKELTESGADMLAEHPSDILKYV